MFCVLLTYSSSYAPIDLINLQLVSDLKRLVDNMWYIIYYFVIDNHHCFAMISLNVYIRKRTEYSKNVTQSIYIYISNGIRFISVIFKFCFISNLIIYCKHILHYFHDIVAFCNIVSLWHCTTMWVKVFEFLKIPYNSSNHQTFTAKRTFSLLCKFLQNWVTNYLRIVEKNKIHVFLKESIPENIEIRNKDKPGGQSLISLFLLC